IKNIMTVNKLSANNLFITRLYCNMFCNFDSDKVCLKRMRIHSLQSERQKVGKLTVENYRLLCLGHKET
ncbi:MAG: hypothetical protein KGZ88_06070, partial [Methylomicrobium sp.]|nr:hypothetical protein [Methylomicrobium sp.]